MRLETKRHAKALPTGARISKGDRRKLNRAISRTVASIDAENRAGLHARQRLNIVRSTPGLTSAARANDIMSNLTNGQLASKREGVRLSMFVSDVRRRVAAARDRREALEAAR